MAARPAAGMPPRDMPDDWYAPVTAEHRADLTRAEQDEGGMGVGRFPTGSGRYGSQDGARLDIAVGNLKHLVKFLLLRLAGTVSDPIPLLPLDHI